MTYRISQNPIADMEFTGLHWIEASAGSGKTYTLSSLMVRLLMDQYLPKQVIATTFTRAAAAELKTRIRLRLQESYRFLNSKREFSPAQNVAQAASQTDPLYAKLQHDFAGRIAYACERLKLVLQQLDELFVGTLDSFSQKLLREFAFESGRTESYAISDEPKQYSLQLIHDGLRQWIQQQPQQLIDWLNQAGEIHSPEWYLSVVENALNFSAAQWSESPQAQQDFQAGLNALRKVDVQAIDSMFQRLAFSSQFIPCANGTSFRNDSFRLLFEQAVPAWLSILQAQPSALAIWQHYQNHQKIFDALYKNVNNNKVFNKKLAEADQQRFYQDSGILALMGLIAQCQKLSQLLQSIASQLQRYLCQMVAQRLPELLQQHRETTFAMQIQSLAQALQAPHGTAFAHAVHQRYPLILVDEFQDTNFEQDLMLRSIWRQPSRLNLGCMIMVGDRKQAIYGFRGGDMLTFIQAHAEVQQKQGRFYELAYNHRSVASLVQAVDALMQQQTDFGEQVQYRPVQAGSRPHPALMDNQVANPTPLRWFEVEKAQEPEQVAWQILQLLQQSAQSELYFGGALADQTRQAVVEDDIAILATSHRQLDAVQQALSRLGVRVQRPSKRSVFDSSTAQDVAALLLALQHPHDEARLKRALLTRMLGLNLADIQQLSASAQGLSGYMAQFDALQKIWREQGFMQAWQKLLQNFHVWQNLVATQADDNERCVVNLRHLNELLNQHSQQQGGMHRLMAWYFMQLQRPAQRDWEVERKLSKAAGVQLLSIHQSKGLEFKIVFLLGVNQKPKNQTEPLTFSTTAAVAASSNTATSAVQDLSLPELKRVIQISADPNLSDAAKQAHAARRQAEFNRLWYVAITRASHRVYAMWHVDGAADAGLGFWRSATSAALPLSSVQAAIATCPTWRPLPQASGQAAAVLNALPMPQMRFYPRSKTSFTALAPQHQFAMTSLDALAILPEAEQPSADEALPEAHSTLLHTCHLLNINPVFAVTHADHNMTELDVAVDDLQHGSEAPRTVEAETHSAPTTQTTIGWIQSAFPKGAQAGNFLHELLEGIDFQDHSLWPEQWRRRLDNQYPQLKKQLWQRYCDEIQPSLAATLSDAEFNTVFYRHLNPLLMDWMQQIIHTPLHAGFQLSQLDLSSRVAEFSFDLSLQDQVFESQKLQQLLNEYLYPQFGIRLATLQDAFTARYLTGSIDLLYWQQGRFYIADYKSNFLGTTSQDYAPQAIQRSMTEACYWLQAALYLVALHRYLTVYWPQYHIEQHLGGASYLYLRGMQAQAHYGVMYWPAPTALILALDAVLGYAKPQAA